MTQEISQREFDESMHELRKMYREKVQAMIAEQLKNKVRNRELYEQIQMEAMQYSGAKDYAKSIVTIKPADPKKRAMRKIYSLQRHLKHTIADFFPDRTLTDEELMVQFSETEESVLFNIVIKKANGNV